MAEFKSEPLKSWTRGKELRENYYSYYRDAHERGAIRAAGGAWAFDACLAGLEPVAWLTSEPYAASVAWNRRFAAECQEAVEAYGYPRDLCAYMRNYWGSILVNKYAFGGPFPKPDVLWQNHICCSHGKWYQTINELEGGDIPFYCVDMGVGAYPPFMELREYKMKYVADQLLDGIEWLERIVGKKFGRRYDDEQFIEAVWNDIRSTSKWAEICVLNQVVPAPLDEKTMYSLYVLATLQKSSQWCADFYAELYEDVKDRVDRGIAAVPDEKVRIITDNQPPWAFLNMFR